MKKIYEIALHRVAWYAVEAESPEDAIEIAKRNDELDQYEDQDGEALYVPEEIEAEDAEHYKDHDRYFTSED